MNTSRMLLLVVLSLPCFAADDWQALPPVTSVHILRNGVELMAGKSAIQVVAVRDDVIRIRVARNGKFPPDFSWAVLPETVRNPPPVDVSDSPQAVRFSTKNGSVRLEKSPLRIVFLDPAGKTLQSDARTMAFTGDAFRVWKTMPEDEHYYGLGDKAGSMDRRGRSFFM
ncbi:MAG TPA: hypothetical protein VGF06_06960, partial [Terriglobales bacterium]